LGKKSDCEKKKRGIIPIILIDLAHKKRMVVERFLYSIFVYLRTDDLFTFDIQNSAMNNVDALRNDIINKLLTISNKAYLSAIFELLNSSNTGNDLVKPTQEQILMLQLSDDDIAAGRLISQSQLDQDDLQWLKEL